jgi:hypothetical protein
MRTLRVPDPSPPYITDRDDMYAPSRHDAEMMMARIIPPDPYTTWLDERERERRLRASVDAIQGPGESTDGTEERWS